MAKVREHSEARGPGGRCLYCGAVPGPNNGNDFGERQCVERDDHDHEKPKPEPKLREMAADDADTISDRIKEIEAERIEAVNKE
jgi:hypothetical protein